MCLASFVVRIPKVLSIFFPFSNFLSLVSVLRVRLSVRVRLRVVVRFRFYRLHRSFVSSFSVLRGSPSRWYDLCTTRPQGDFDGMYFACNRWILLLLALYLYPLGSALVGLCKHV